MTAIVQAFDPFGYCVTIENFICEVDGIPKDVSYLKHGIIHVIQRPAMLIESFDTSLYRYYFGAIDWERTILVGVRNKNRTWVVTKCFENPSSHIVYPIFRQGNQLI